MSALELETFGTVWPTQPLRRSLLTQREWEVATAVAGGATNREASRQLFLSEKTIEMHLTRVYRKLGIRSRCQLAVLFAQFAASGESRN